MNSNIETMKNMYLVIGPESSGNHVTELILSRMGCYGGGERKEGRKSNSERKKVSNFIYGYNSNLEFVGNKPIVVMRSIPNRRSKDDDPMTIRSIFLRHNYKIFTIIPVRNWAANILSNYRVKSIEDSKELLVESWIWLGEKLRYLKPFYFLNTSFLFKYPDIAIKELVIFTGLKYGGDPNFDIIKDPDKARHKTFMEYGLKIVDEASKKRMMKWKNKSNKIRIKVTYGVNIKI